MNGVIRARDHDFADIVLGSAVPVVVGFCDSRPSAACAPLAAVLDELAAEGAGIGVVRVDVDDAPRTAAAYGVSAVPSVVVFAGGAMLLALPGAPLATTVLHLLRIALPTAPTSPEPV